MKNSIALSLFIFVSLSCYAQTFTSEESNLYKLVMEYRKQKGLPAIPVSRLLSFVAQTHVKDLANNKPYQGNCNMHSWSAAGKWSACCYTPDHAQASCMWNKPRELTTYKGNGYEIAFWSSDSARSNEALESWKKSPGHNPVIVNEGIWKKYDWKAIGIGVYKNYAVIWFGSEVDN